MERNVENVRAPPKNLLQSDDLYQVLYHSLFLFFLFFVQLFLIKFAILLFNDVAVYPGD